MTARSLVLAVVLALVGCAPLDGYPCETEAATQCEGARVAYCERANSGGLKWKAYDCPSGCDPLKATAKCDWKGAVGGAVCPAGLAAQTHCPGDGKIMLCLAAADGGAWVDSTCERCVSGAATADVLRCSGGTCFCR